MKNLLIVGLIVGMLLLTGCARAIIGYNLNQIPNIAFDTLKYKRSHPGNLSSALIEATGASIVDGVLRLERVKVVEKFPIMNIEFELENVQRDVVK